MRMVLLQKSSANPRKIWLSPGQSLRIGRTEEADHAVREDGQMSGLHFALHCQADQCQLEDLDSTNGTFLNGQPVDRARLADGDEIRAGQTSFTVVLEGTTVAAEREQVRPQTPPVTAPPAIVAPPSRPPPTAPGVPPPVATSPTPAADPPGQLAKSRLRLECLGGDMDPPNVWLGQGGQLTVGRTAQADVRIAADEQMSGRHFALDCDVATVRLRDLESANGTHLNGHPVGTAVLSDGDRIEAGQSQFVVHLQGGPDVTPQRRQQQQTSAQTTVGTAAVVSLRPTFQFRAVRCYSQLELLVGTASQVDLEPMAAALTTLQPLYLLLPPGEVGTNSEEPPPGIRPIALPRSGNARPPRLWQPERPDLGLALLTTAWGENRMAALFCSQPPVAIAKRLVAFTRQQETCCGSPQNTGFRPQPLIECLANSGPQQIADWSELAGLLLAEIHQAERWGLLGPRGTAKQLATAGFALAPAWQR